LSIVAVRGESGLQSQTFDLRTAVYHGSYLAAATVALPAVGEAVFVSVHAAPTEVERRYTDLWPGALPPAREASNGVLWDADMVAATLRELAAAGPTLAADDFNEAREFDGRSGRAWGVEYFAGLEAAGLVDVTYRRSGVERPTRGAFQDDHIVATSDVDALITDPVVVELPAEPDVADHHPLWWTIESGPSGGDG